MSLPPIAAPIWREVLTPVYNYQFFDPFVLVVGNNLVRSKMPGLILSFCKHKETIMEPSVLVGETLKYIDIVGEVEILLTTESGRVFRFYHEQDCCESVCIEDTHGEWKTLIGKTLLEVSEDVFPNGGPPPNEDYNESWTRTILRFRVDGGTVISRWIGTSNGYYSESVDFSEITK